MDRTRGTDEPEVLWAPGVEETTSSQTARFARWVEVRHGLHFEGYEDLWRWSVDDPDAFWTSVWEYFAVVGGGDHSVGLADPRMPGARWFPEVSVNYAENLLARAPIGPAVLERSQTRAPREVTGVELADLVARARNGLVERGVVKGDRVAAYMPNSIDTLVILLATASLGAVFSCCPPEFGTKAVIDRFRQIEPKVLVCSDGYRHRGREIDRTAVIEEIRAGLPSVETAVLHDYLGVTGRETWVGWAELVEKRAVLAFERVAFDHPLVVLYTSGTTGPPKAIVHGHGGVTLEHIKLHNLQHGLNPGDRFFWHSTTGWVMWNYLISGLMAGASIVLFDGDPLHPGPDTLWEIVEETGTTVFGASPSLFGVCQRAGLVPGAEHRLDALWQVGSTGSLLSADLARWIYSAVGSDVMLVSASGGTDVASAFVAGSPLSPVYAGRISCRCLGVKAEAYDEGGRPVVDTVGELVITAAMPSMPVAIWGDSDGSRYRSTWFDRFPGVWSHGDWVTFGRDGSAVISGRSDATLNRGGVRLGTSDFYAVLEEIDGVEDSLVIHLDDRGSEAGQLVLFVVLGGGAGLADVVPEIRAALRTALSPRHMPDRVYAVPEVPYTATGKKLEIPVKRIMQGVVPGSATNLASVRNPAALDAFVLLAGEEGAGVEADRRIQVDAEDAR